jgi:putative ATP-dependent endonuclease of the OLD family
VDLTLEPLTAIVGPNGSGKSALLRAIDLVLGERWPSLASLRLPEDFTDFDVARELSVQVTFRQPLVCDADAAGERAQIHHLRICCRPYKNTGKWGAAGDPNFDFDALDATEERPMQCVSARKGAGRDYRPLLGVPSELRQQSPAVLISHQRAIAQQMPWTRGSVLLKLLAPARKELDDVVGDGDEPQTRREVFSERYEHAMAVLRSPHIKTVEETIDETTKRTLGFLGRAAASEISVGFGIADPANPLNSFRIMYREGAMEIPAEEAGLGVQSAIVVGLFEALRQTRAQAGVVLIDEPEMYLHPQAQRYFYGLLADMADTGQAQVVYSTHSPVFAEAYRFESLRILRRAHGGYSSVAAADARARAALESDRNKLLANYDASRSEALFADGVLLVEGPGDQLAAREVASTIPIDLDAENLSVVSCGGKTAIPYHARLCRALGIPVCALYDDDLVPDPPEEDASSSASKARENNKRARRETAEIQRALPSSLDRFACSPNLEAELGVSAQGKDKPARVLQAVRDDPEAAPAALRDAVLRLGDLTDSAPPPF